MSKKTISKKCMVWVLCMAMMLCSLSVSSYANAESAGGTLL